MKIEPLNQNTNNIIPIVVSANDPFVPYLSVMLESLLENSDFSNIYDLVVLHRNITKENEDIIKWQIKKFEHASIRFLNVSSYFENLSLFIDQHLSVETYYRLVIPDIMPDYKKILYLDADMIIEGDIANLFHTDIENKMLAAVKDIDIAGQINLNPNVAEYIEKKLGLESAFNYFQAGVLILNLEEIRKRITTSELLKLAQSYSWRCHDQDVLNIVAKNSVIYLPQLWNTLMDWKEGGASRMDILKMAPINLFDEYLEARKTPQIVHFAGYQKPWNVLNCDFSFYFWKYARQTPYYEDILSRLFIKLTEEKFEKYYDAKINEVKNVIEQYCDKQIEEYKNQQKSYFYERYSLKARATKILNVLLPYHSKRREAVKIIIRKVMK